jgi:hypothetical protein
MDYKTLQEFRQIVFHHALGTATTNPEHTATCVSVLQLQNGFRMKPTEEDEDKVSKVSIFYDMKYIRIYKADDIKY